MNFEVFRRHSFFEGLDWDRLQEHELWEDFPSLDRAFSREKDDDNSSPSPSPSAEEETSQIPGKGQFFMVSESRASETLDFNANCGW